MLESLTADSIIEEILPVLDGVVKPEKPVLYFGRAIRGGRENIENSRKIASEADKHFYIISKHVLLDKRYDKDDVSDFERKWKEKYPRIDVRQRDMKMLGLANCFAADATIESTGIGFETCVASCERKIPSVLFQHENRKNESTMIIHTGRIITPTLKDYLDLHNIKVPIFYYSDQNVEEVARKCFERFSSCFLTKYF